MRREFDVDLLPRTRKQALEMGSIYYFTNKPCAHGHIAPRSTWGRCIECYRSSWSDENNKKLYTYTREWYRKHPHKRLVNQARVRAKRKGIAFDLTYEDVVIPSHCPVLGIPLTSHIGKRMQDDSASIDRVDSSKGYTKDNIVIVSWKANRLKSNGTIEELKQIVEFYLKRKSLDNGTQEK